MLKRGGRAHDPAGAGATKEGELTVECPACPHPGKNLPDDWKDSPPHIRSVQGVCHCILYFILTDVIGLAVIQMVVHAVPHA